MSLRVLLVVPSLDPLGPAFQLFQCAPDLAASSIELHCLTTSAEDEPAWRDVANLGEVHRPPRPLSKPATKSFVSRTIATVRPDVIHDWMSGPEVQAAIALTRYRWLDTCIDPAWYAPQARWRGSPAAMGTILFDEPSNRRRGLSLPWHRSHAPRRFAVARSVRSNPVDRTRVRDELAKQFGIPQSSKLISCAAPLEPRTRLKDLIWALDLLLCIRDDVYLIIVGEGPQEPWLRKLLATTPAKKHIAFVGKPSDPLSMIAASDLFWHSHLEQQLPDALLWAMSCRVPVVAAWGVPTQPILRHQQTGMGAELGRRDQFARWAKYVFEQPDRAAQMVAQAHQFVTTNYAPEVATQQLAAAYEAVARTACES